jgi:hypothetical protein
MLVARDADDVEKPRVRIFLLMGNDLLQVIFAVRPNQVPRHLNAGPTLQADAYRTTGCLPQERHN